MSEQDCTCPVCNGTGKVQQSERGKVKVVVMDLMKRLGVSRRTAFRRIKRGLTPNGTK